VGKTERLLGALVCSISRKSAKKRRSNLELKLFEPVLYSAVQLRRLNNKRTYKKHVGAKQMATRETGNVKWFNDAKGYGFIQREDGKDVFVHYRAIRGEGHRSLSEGQQVEYAVVTGEKGLQAEDVVGL
jgi:CspA family cold shock protein